MAKNKQKVKKYRKPLNINIGMIIFSTVFIYVVVCVVMYFQSSPIVRYEVKEGSLASSNIYRGIALREETTVYSDHTGYINYYAREGEKVAKDDLFYSSEHHRRKSDPGIHPGIFGTADRCGLRGHLPRRGEAGHGGLQ